MFCGWFAVNNVGVVCDVGFACVAVVIVDWLFAWLGLIGLCCGIGCVCYCVVLWLCCVLNNGVYLSDLFVGVLRFIVGCYWWVACYCYFVVGCGWFYGGLCLCVLLGGVGLICLVYCLQLRCVCKVRCWVLDGVLRVVWVVVIWLVSCLIVL